MDAGGHLPSLVDTTVVVLAVAHVAAAANKLNKCATLPVVAVDGIGNNAKAPPVLPLPLLLPLAALRMM
jgi:hypothetical protein